jgi:hypothetical protein
MRTRTKQEMVYDYDERAWNNQLESLANEGTYLIRLSAFKMDPSVGPSNPFLKLTY